MRFAVLTTLVLLAAAACRERGQQRQPSAPASAPTALDLAEPASVSASRGPIARAEVRVPGLQVRSGSIGGNSAWGFSELALDLSQVRLEIVQAPGGAPLQRLLPPSALAIVNGGYFEADFRPSTWLMHAGVQLAPKSDTSKGGVLAVRQRDVYLGPFSGLAFEPELAIQSFPLIVEVDGSSGINRDDGRRAARTVVCWVGSQLHFVLLAAPRGEGPTLFEAAKLLREPWPEGFGCRAALNLDGGPSSGAWFSPKVGAKQRAPFAPVAYGIALVPR